MSKNSSAKYYQYNKERLNKKSCERYQSYFKKEKGKSDNMAMKNTTIYQKMKNKSWLSMEKINIK